MNEYISREDVLKKTKSSISVPVDNEWDCGYNTAMAEMQEFIKQLPAADVQPVPQWISVDDRLPESEKEVLVWYRYTWGAAPMSYGFGINRWYSNAKQWRDGCLLKGVKVLFWQPLPEPPKDGDTNG